MWKCVDIFVVEKQKILVLEYVNICWEKTKILMWNYFDMFLGENRTSKYSKKANVKVFWYVCWELAENLSINGRKYSIGKKQKIMNIKLCWYICFEKILILKDVNICLYRAKSWMIKSCCYIFWEITENLNIKLHKKLLGKKKKKNWILVCVYIVMQKQKILILK